MITCKEDLYDTFIDASDKSLVAKYLELLMGFGIDWSRKNNKLTDTEFLEVTNVGSGFKLFTTVNPESKSRQLTMADFIQSNDVKYYDKGEEINPQDFFVSDGIKSVTKCLTRTYSIADDEASNIRIGDELIDNKKVRTKTEYVKVTESIFDLRDEFEAGNLYVNLLGNSNQYAEIEEELTLIDEIRDDNVYRKVETEIDWRNDVLEYLESFGGDECKTFIEAIMENKNAGVKSHNYDGFISMCRLVVDSVDKK